MMLKKDLLLSLSVFALVLFIDFMWKLKMTTGEINHQVNHGFIFGTLQDLPASLTMVTLCSIGALLMFIYILMILFLSPKLTTLKIGLSIFAGGVMGNVLDRAIHGSTMDFIPLDLPFFPPVIFNPADVFQWIGAILIIAKLITKEKVIWHPSNQRRFTLINPVEQMKFALKFALITGCTCLVLGIFSLSFLSLALQSVHSTMKSPLISFAISYFAITFCCVGIAFFSGLLLSQRSIGPVYAFEKFVEGLLKGEQRNLKLREGDNFKSLETVADNLRDHINGKE
jgi:signal peptidase II